MGRMKRQVIAALLLLAVTSAAKDISGGDDVADGRDCPLWTHRQNSTSPCVCYDTTANGLVECDTDTLTLRLQFCTCLTHDYSTNKTIAGYCSYSCIANRYNPVRNIKATSNYFSKTCDLFKRKGPLCSECIHGYGVPLYTYSLKCVKCSSFEFKKLIKFLSVSLIPPTILFLLITVFHVHILHPPISVFALAAQLLSTPILLQATLSIEIPAANYYTVTFIASIYGVWNLDFFKAIYTPECIGPQITTLEAYAIEGLIGLYPLVLCFILYVLITIRSRGFKIALKIHFLCSRLRGTFNLRESIIGTFATLFLLSYMKIGFSAFYILSPTQVWRPNCHHMAVYMDPSTPYFRSYHALYATVTLLLALVLVIFPIILLLFYPRQWFQKFLNCFNLRPLALDMTMDVFYGCYKDGTNGTRDCRCFAAFQLMLRLVMPFLFFSTKEPICSMFLSTIILGAYITAFVIMKPYKRGLYNTTDIPILMTVLCLGIIQNVTVFFKVYNYSPSISDYVSEPITILGLIAPLIYFAIWACIYARSTLTKRRWCCQPKPESEQLLQN